MGVSVVMITGDNEETANAIAKQVGIENVISKSFAKRQEEKIRQLSEYGNVTMVGDGINDAPALTRASTGIAIGAGTDVAIDAADVVTMRSDPVDIPSAITLSRKVIRNIKENLFWAFIYNIIGIPVICCRCALSCIWYYTESYARCRSNEPFKLLCCYECFKAEYR